jgi:hypothetical protein
MPLVAMGITAAQVGFAPLLECGAAVLMAAAGALTGVLHLRLARQPGAPLGARRLWGIAGLAFLVGMTLAALYGTRSYLPVAWLDIPWMRAMHGTANAMAGLAGLIGWTLAEELARPV